MRHTRAHTKNRRSHHALSGARLSTDTKTGAVHLRHKALLDGTPYRGRSVMDKTRKVKASSKAASAKASAKESGKEKAVKKKSSAQ